MQRGVSDEAAVLCGEKLLSGVYFVESESDSLH